MLSQDLSQRGLRVKREGRLWDDLEHGVRVVQEEYGLALLPLAIVMPRKFFVGGKFFLQEFPKTSVTALLPSCYASAMMMPSGPRRRQSR
jgi:hypothetical protein